MFTEFKRHEIKDTNPLKRDECANFMINETDGDEGSLR
jgi:hypothetical protein